MTPKAFRDIALSFPESSESGHRSRPDFRVDGKIFATLFPEEHWAVVKITPELQSELVEEDTEAFQACKGAWGRNGATIVSLPEANEGSVLRALATAWQKFAPSTLTEGRPDQNHTVR